MRPSDCTDKNRTLLDSTLSAMCGLWDAVRREPKVRQVFVAAVLVPAACVWVGADAVYLILVILSWVFALVCELFNTALEKALDYACKMEIHPLIRESKDYAAACTFVSLLATIALSLFVLASGLSG